MTDIDRISAAPVQPVTSHRPGARPLAPQQPEDYLAILRGICAANWLALATMLGAGLLIRAVEPTLWRMAGHITLAFWLVAIEFGLLNLALSWALHDRGWLERTPREALNRLRQLLHIVLCWDAIHVLGAIEAFGGLSSPLLALIPVLILMAYLILPTPPAHWQAGALLFGLTLIVALQLQGVLHAGGAFGVALQAPGLWPWLTVLLIAPLLLAMVFFAHRVRLSPGLVHRPGAPLHDALGLWHKDTLLRRLNEECQRGARLGSSLSLVIIRIRDFDTLNARQGYAASRARLAELATRILEVTRQDLDTAASWDDVSFALLLPTADVKGAQAVCERLRQRCATSPVMQDAALHFGVAASTSQIRKSPEALERAALEALSTPGP